jgi:dihydropteroate synthase
MTVPRATQWQLRTRMLEFSARPLVMGILNVTPDSFSDGGHFLDAERAIERGLAMAEDGADIIDIGGESTRPYAQPVPEEEELRRVEHVVRELSRQIAVPISIDTTKALVAERSLAAGAEIINDISGLEADPRMLEVALSSGAGICAMHMRGTPQTMQDDPRYEDVVAEIHEYLRQRRDTLEAAGIARERICLDPGIGFGKTHAHNLELLRNVGQFHSLGCPLLVGHSRKGFIAHVIQDREADRLPGTIGVACALALAGVQVIRVHDVAAVRQALLLFEASRPGA